MQSSDDHLPVREVKVITDADMKAAFAEERRRFLAGERGNTPVSDISVQGYPTDIQSPNSGIGEISVIVRMLENAKIPCCLVTEPALIYYGAGRVVMDWVICVPTKLHPAAVKLVTDQSGLLEPFKPSAMTRVNSIEHLFPRFKFIGKVVFFVLLSSQACHLPCDPENIEYSGTGMPYPKLHIYAQSLLETYSIVDLDDLIDGMNLTLDWGEEHLKLDADVDIEWAKWRAALLYGGAEKDKKSFSWQPETIGLRGLWTKEVSDEEKRNRQRHKISDTMETRFWRRGQKDPRSKKRDYV